MNCSKAISAGPCGSRGLPSPWPRAAEGSRSSAGPRAAPGCLRRTPRPRPALWGPRGRASSPRPAWGRRAPQAGHLPRPVSLRVATRQLLISHHTSIKYLFFPSLSPQDWEYQYSSCHGPLPTVSSPLSQRNEARERLTGGAVRATADRELGSSEGAAPRDAVRRHLRTAHGRRLHGQPAPTPLTRRLRRASGRPGPGELADGDRRPGDPGGFCVTI